MSRTNTTIERVLGKIDNDFNPDNSDWIPRCAAWTYDVLAGLNCLPRKINRREAIVTDQIAGFSFELDTRYLRVFDEYNVEIPNAKDVNNQTFMHSNFIGFSNISDDINERVVSVESSGPNQRSYTIANGNKICLNFDTTKIYVEQLEIVTEFSEYYNCEFPLILDDANLIETISWYCMYRFLARGSKHQVFSLNAQEPTNPYIQYIKYRNKAVASTKITLNRLANDEGWNNFFFNSTFNPRHK